MTISGNLQTMDAAEVLQWLARSSKTGTLVLTDGRTEKKIYFDQGAVTITASSDPSEYLGHFLVSHGLIDEQTLAQAIEMQEQNRMLLGKILVTQGAISEAHLDRMLRLKLEESVYSIFTWPEGEFQFFDGELPDFEIIPLDLNITALIFEGVKRADDWSRIREEIPSTQIVPVAVQALEPPAGDAQASRVLALVDDDRSIEEIVLHSHASEFHVCKILLDQVKAGRVKLVRPRRERMLPPVDTSTNLGSSSLLSAGKRHLASSDLEQALRFFRAALSLEPYNDEIRNEAASAEGLIRGKLAEEGIVGSAVPRLNRPLEDLASLGITPQEGFILSRVDGTYDIQTILKISPMPPLEALLVFRQLRIAKHIVLD
jgi:hypothetical protein